MEIASGNALRTCAAPCQSISRSRSWPRFERRFDLFPAGAVTVVENDRVFEKFAALYHVGELLMADEVVVAAVLLGGSRSRVVKESRLRASALLS